MDLIIGSGSVADYDRHGDENRVAIKCEKSLS
jgi:hypothetical protein